MAYNAYNLVVCFFFFHVQTTPYRIRKDSSTSRITRMEKSSFSCVNQFGFGNRLTDWSDAPISSPVYKLYTLYAYNDVRYSYSYYIIRSGLVMRSSRVVDQTLIIRVIYLTSSRKYIVRVRVGMRRICYGKFSSEYVLYYIFFFLPPEITILIILLSLVYDR